MRVSDNTNTGIVLDSISRSRSRMENLQAQTASMKKVTKPSDDPVGSAKVLEVRTDKVNNDQFASNGKLAEAFLGNTDHALEDLSDILMRAKELAINQSSAASSTQESRLGIAEEVSQLYQRAIATGNRRIGDRFLFGGFKSTNPPVDADGNYHGDHGESMIEIGRDVFIGMNVPGYQIFNSHPESSHDLRQADPEEAQRRLASSAEDGSPGQSPNKNIFQELRALRVGLLTGDLETIRGTLDGFDELLSKVIATRGKVGSRIQGIQGNVQAMERHNLTNAQLTSSIEDADMGQVVSDLAKEETVFKSSLAASKHLIQPTLLEFLR